MYAVGHLALGYLAGKAVSRVSSVNLNLPMLFVASIMPDIDLLIPYFEHRGLTHSIFVSVLFFLPAFLLYGKRVAPYFTALATHSIIGDYLTSEGVKLLWPVTSSWYGGGITVTSPTNVVLEWILFLTSFTVMLRTKDTSDLFQKHCSNFLLSIPVFAVLLPTIFSFPLYLPIALLVPHLAYLSLFSLSILIDLEPYRSAR